jgi:hypothetical protein
MQRFYRNALVALTALFVSATTAQAGAHCPAGTYVARYSFGIWVCKQPTRARLACPPGRRLGTDHVGTPKCVRRAHMIDARP